MARLLAAVIILFPLSFVRVDQRGAALLPLVIQVEKTSPAFAAFEDLQNDYLEETTPIQFAKEVVHLSSGEEYMPEASAPAPITFALKPIKIRRQIQQQDVARDLPEWEDSENLPPLQKRKEILLANLSRAELRQPTVSERAEELVQQELKKRERREQTVKEIPTVSGGTIIVRKDTPGGSEVAPYVAYNHNQRQEAQESRTIAGGRGVETRGKNNFLVTGDIRLDGVPEMGQHTKWRVYRKVNGRKAETGSVNIQQARFSIQVNERKGVVVAELSDHFGRVFGRGQASLENQNLALYVRPVDSTTVAAYVPSFVGPSQASAVAATYKPFGSSLMETYSEKSLDVSHYSEDSRLFIEATTRDHYPTVAIGFLSALKQIPLYTYKVIKAFRSIVKSFYKPIDIQKLALIWGKVTKDGQPVSGANVEMAGVEGRVVYFNEIGIPRGELATTSSSGQFAIVNVPEGVQSVRVTHEGRTYPAQVFPSFSGKLTHLNLEIPTQFISQIFKSFSLTGGEASVPTSLRVVGAEEIYDIESETEVLLPDLSGGVMVEADSGPQYELLRTHLPRLIDKVKVSLPAISVDWVNQILQDSNQVLDRRLGWAIGFVGESEAEVRLLNSQDGLHKIIYFDQNLKLQQGNYAPAGGGFLALNLPLGYQTLEVRGLHSAQSLVESFVSEPYFLHLIGSQRFINPLGQEDL